MHSIFRTATYMSAEPERVFSGCRRTISWQRMRYGVKIREEGECLKSWIRFGSVRVGSEGTEKTWKPGMASKALLYYYDSKSALLPPN